jgi:D-alanyl-D-alanine endopeptidase (penicillin-binding protein 7)
VVSDKLFVMAMPRLLAAASVTVLLAGPASAPAAAPAAHKRPAKHHALAVHGHKKHVMLERHVAATRGGQPNVQALAALVLDEDGRAVYGKNPDKERPIASISKLAATLAVVGRGLELEGLSTINASDVEVAKGGARSRLLEGMTLSNRDLLHAALMGSDNRAIPALGRAVKLNPTQLTAAMNAKVRQLGLKNTRFHEPTGLSTSNVSTPRETIAMLKEVISHPVLGPITRRGEYDAHPVGKPPIRYINTDHAAARGNVQVLGGKTGYNDDARYCLVVATRIDGRAYYMAFLGNEGKMTRFGDVARVADWITSHAPKTSPATPPAPAVAAAPPPVGVSAPATPPAPVAAEAVASAPARPPVPLPVGVAAPTPDPAPAPPSATP